jgi:hypothetical protein
VRYSAPWAERTAAGAAAATAPVAALVTERLRQAGLADPAVTVTAVAATRRDPRTGKAPLFVPLSAG